MNILSILNTFIPVNSNICLFRSNIIDLFHINTAKVHSNS